MLTTKYVPVKEAYFGKSKNLLEIEKILPKIIERFRVPFKDIGKRIVEATKVNTSKENKQIESLLCKEFGFKEMVLHWDGSNTVNAYTVTYGLIKLVDSDQPSAPIRNGDGTYYDAKHKYICVVNFYAGFIDQDITPAEIVACILHEIGHNFVCTPVVNVVSMLEWAMIPVNIYMTWYHFMETMVNVDKAKELIGRAKEYENARDEFKALLNNFIIKGIMSALRANRYIDMIQSGLLRVIQSTFPEYVKKYFSEMDDWIVKNKNKVLAQWDQYVKEINKAKEFYKNNPDFIDFNRLASVGSDFAALIFWHDFAVVQQLISTQRGYSDEVFADSFASAYGYGAATVALQRRIEYYVLNNKALAKANSYNVYNQYIMIMTGIMQTFLDEHPASQTRMKNQINKLRDELNDPNVDPRIRKELIKDLANAEKIYDEYLNKFPPELRHLAVIMNYNQLNEMYFGGKFDLREPINRVLNGSKAEA